MIARERKALIKRMTECDWKKERERRGEVKGRDGGVSILVRGGPQDRERRHGDTET